jgi:shikimate kinase
MIEELAAKNGVIIATGGGVVLNADNRRCLNRSGIVFYLKSSAQRLFERTARDKQRPLLNTSDRKQTIEKLLQERNPLYEEVADFIISTDSEPVKQIIADICQNLGEE